MNFLKMNVAKVNLVKVNLVNITKLEGSVLTHRPRFVAAAVLISIAGLIPLRADAHQAPSTHMHVVTTLLAVPGGNFLHALPGPPKLTYGTLKLATPADINGEHYDLSLVVGLEYLESSGPFQGSFSVVKPGGDELVFDYRGNATLNPDGSTTVTGRLLAFSGTGTFAHITGSGTVNGFRATGLAVGSPVNYTIDLDVRQGERPDPPRSAAIATTERPQSITRVDMSGSPSENFITTNPDGRSYGFERLTGTTRFRGQSVSIEENIEVALVRGNGPINGFLTMSAADGSQLVMRATGAITTSRRGDKPTGITVRAALVVIAGTGNWAGANGSGVLTGIRLGQDGSISTDNIALTLR